MIQRAGAKAPLVQPAGPPRAAKSFNKSAAPGAWLN